MKRKGKGKITQHFLCNTFFQKVCKIDTDTIGSIFYTGSWSSKFCTETLRFDDHFVMCSIQRSERTISQHFSTLYDDLWMSIGEGKGCNISESFPFTQEFLNLWSKWIVQCGYFFPEGISCIAGVLLGNKWLYDNVFHRERVSSSTCKDEYFAHHVTTREVVPWIRFSIFLRMGISNNGRKLDSFLQFRADICQSSWEASLNLGNNILGIICSEKFAHSGSSCHYGCSVCISTTVAREATELFGGGESQWIFIRRDYGSSESYHFEVKIEIRSWTISGHIYENNIRYLDTQERHRSQDRSVSIMHQSPHTFHIGFDILSMFPWESEWHRTRVSKKYSLGVRYPKDPCRMEMIEIPNIKLTDLFYQCWSNTARCSDDKYILCVYMGVPLHNKEK